jgi:hypothetical protein
VRRPSSALIAVAACLAAGCGGGDEEQVDTVDSSVVRRALTQTVKQFPFATAYRGEVSIGGRRAPYGGDGWHDRDGFAQLTVDLSKVAPLHGQAGGAPPDWRVEMLVGDPFMWVKSGRLTDELRLGKRPWGKLDARVETRDPLLNPTVMLGGVDLADPLDVLRGLEPRVEKRGEETVRGAPATHYRGRVDVAQYERIAQRAPNALALKAPGGGRAVDLDIWIDEQGLIARIAYEAASADGRGTVTVSQELFDFFNQLDPDAPYEYEETDLRREQRRRS